MAPGSPSAGGAGTGTGGGRRRPALRAAASALPLPPPLPLLSPDAASEPAASSNPSREIEPHQQQQHAPQPHRRRSSCPAGLMCGAEEPPSAADAADAADAANGAAAADAFAGRAPSPPPIQPAARWQPAMARIASGQDLAESAAALPARDLGAQQKQHTQQDKQQQQQQQKKQQAKQPKQQQQRQQQEEEAQQQQQQGPPSSTASTPAAPRSDDALQALEHVVRAHRERQQRRAASDAAGAAARAALRSDDAAPPLRAAAASEPSAARPAAAARAAASDGAAALPVPDDDPDDAERAALVADGEAPASLGLDAPPDDAAAAVRAAVTDDHLLQFGALVGELSSRAALAAREGCGGPVGHPGSLYGSPDTDAFSHGWEPVVAEAAPRLLYWAWRRPLRRGLYAYMTRTVFYGATPAEARAFMLDDSARAAWDDSSALTAPVPPLLEAAARAAAEARAARGGGGGGGGPTAAAAAAATLARAKRMGGRAESDLLHGRVRMPKPMAPRVYCYARRVWPRPSDGGCYSLARAVGGGAGGVAERAAAAAGGGRGVAVADFASGCVIRAPPPALVPPGAGPAAEVLMVYFEDGLVPARFANLGIRKALWPLVERTERALRRHQAGAFAAERAACDRLVAEARLEARARAEAAEARRASAALAGGGRAVAFAPLPPPGASSRSAPPGFSWGGAALSALAAAAAAPAARAGLAVSRALLLGAAAQVLAAAASSAWRAAGRCLPRLEFRFARWMLRSLAAPRWARRRSAAAGPRRALALHRVASHARAAVAAAESLRSHDTTDDVRSFQHHQCQHPRHGEEDDHGRSGEGGGRGGEGGGEGGGALRWCAVVPLSHALASLDEDDVHAGGGPAPPEWPLAACPMSPVAGAAQELLLSQRRPRSSAAAAAASAAAAAPPRPCPGCIDCRGAAFASVGGAWTDDADFYGGRLGACGAAFDAGDDDDGADGGDDDDDDDLASEMGGAPADAAAARAQRRRRRRRRRTMVLRLMQAAGVRLVHRVLAQGV